MVNRLKVLIIWAFRECENKHSHQESHYTPGWCFSTWRDSISDPRVLQNHLLLLFIGAEQKAVSLLTQVVRTFQVPDHRQLLLQGLHLGNCRRHHILVMDRNGGMLKTNQLAQFSCPETCGPMRSSTSIDHYKTFQSKISLVYRFYFLF